MEFYEKIKCLREDADMKQEELAAVLGITRPQYSLYETGKREFKVRHIQQLCRYFHISADYVLDLPDGMPYGFSKTRQNKKR